MDKPLSYAKQIVQLLETRNTVLWTTGEVRALAAFQAAKDIPTLMADMATGGKIRRPARGLYCGLNFEGDLDVAVAAKQASAPAVGGIAGKIKAAAAKAKKSPGQQAVHNREILENFKAGKPVKAPRGTIPCPWCGEPAVPSAKADPIIDVMCDACDAMGFNELSAKYPEKRKLFDERAKVLEAAAQANRTETAAAALAPKQPIDQATKDLAKRVAKAVASAPVPANDVDPGTLGTARAAGEAPGAAPVAGKRRKAPKDTH